MSLEKNQNFKFQLTDYESVKRSSKEPYFRISTLYRSSTSRHIARVIDSMFKLFTYFKDNTCPDPNIPGFYVVTLVILVCNSSLWGDNHADLCIQIDLLQM